jgi:hypothetical protein
LIGNLLQQLFAAMRPRGFAGHHAFTAFIGKSVSLKFTLDRESMPGRRVGQVFAVFADAPHGEKIAAAVTPVRLRKLDIPYTSARPDIQTIAYRSTLHICDHSASFFKLNHFFSFGFSVLSGSGGVLGGLGFRPSLRASSFAIR